MSRLEDGFKDTAQMIKERLRSFAEYAEDAQPGVLVTLIQTITERTYTYANSFTTRAARVRGRSTDLPVRAWTLSFISTV